MQHLKTELSQLIKRCNLEKHSATLGCGLALTLCATLVIADSAVELETVTVSSQLFKEMTNTNFSDEANLGLLGDAGIKNTPISVVTFTKESIKNTQARQLSDLITQDSSVRSSGAYGDNAESFYVRGIPLGDWNQGEFAFDGIYGVAPNYKVPTDLFDAVSVVKGPSSVLFGMSPRGAVGGAINLVPKRAYEDSKEIELRYTNDSRPGFAVDLSQRFGDERQFGARFNLAHDNGGTPIDNLDSESTNLSLSLDYIGQNTITTLDLLSTSEDIDAPFRRIRAGSLTSLPSAPDNSFNTAQEWEFSDSEEQLALFKHDYFFTEDTQLGFYVGGGESEVKRLFQRRGTFTNTNGDMSTGVSAGQFEVSRLTYGVKGKTEFDTGGLNHQLNLDYSNYEGTVKRSLNNAYAGYTTNIYNPVAHAPQTFTLTSPVAKNLETKLKSIALSDTITNQDEDILVTLGGRYQNIEVTNYNSAGVETTHYDESEFSPFLGVVYKPVDNLSLYLNYTEALASGEAAPSYAINQGEVFEPYQATQFEVGAKYNHNDIDYALALFTMDRRAGEYDAATTRYEDTKELKYRGVELSASGKLTEGVIFSSALTYLDTSIEETALDINRSHVGGAPELLANVGVDIDIPFVNGLSMGNYLIYSDKQYVADGSDVVIPSWTRWDLGMKYETKLNEQDLTVLFDVSNVTNKKYWEGASQFGYVSSGQPRVYSLSVSTKF